MTAAVKSLKLSNMDLKEMNIMRYEFWKGVNYEFKLFKDHSGIYLNDEKIKVNEHEPNFIHDFTFSYFGKLDYHYHGLTPDYIEDDKLCEFATVMNDDFDAMESVMHMKYKKYSHLLEGNDKKLIVIVVSLTKIVSNYELSDEILVSVITNFNAIKQIQGIFLEEGKKLWYDKDGDKIDKIMKKILEDTKGFVSRNPLEESFEMIDNVWNEYNFDIGVEKVLDELMISINESIQNESYKEETYNFIPDLGVRTDTKRITQIPMIIPKLRQGKRKTFQICNFENANEINKIINESLHNVSCQVEDFDKTTYDDYLLLRSKMNEKDHERKTFERFTVELNDEELLKLALHGVQAKSQKNQIEVKNKREKSKEYFSYEVNTKDINDFITEGKSLLKFKHKKMKAITEPCFQLIKDSLLISASEVNGTTRQEDLEALDDFIKFSSSKIGLFLSFMNDLVFELNCNLRTNVKTNEFIVKPLRRFNATLFIKTTKSSSHMFFFVVANDCEILSETIGPKLTKLENLVFSEWGSVLKRDLESFLNAREKMFNVFVTLKLLHDVEDMSPNKAVCDHFMLTLLLLLNNKDRNEEIITNLRYVYMKSLSITEKSSQMLKKYETKFRDRFSVYLTKKVVELCVKLDSNPPQYESNHGVIKINGMLDIFGNELTFKQSINFSYLGYIMTKVKQMQGNQSFKMIEKILSYELKAIDLKAEEISIKCLNNEQTHKFDYIWVRTFTEISKTQLIHRFGHNFPKLLHQKIVNRFKACNFETLATLKASAKMDILDDKNEFSIKKLKERRPRVIESLFNFVDSEPVHPLNVVSKCIKQINELDKFNVELFPKDQHNGLREIYVVDFRVRIVQWFIETISRSICDLFPSETLNNINSADGLTNKIMKNSYKLLSRPFPLIKSGDASKWSQSQIVSKFYIVLKSFLPNEYHAIIKNILKLWLNKKIFLPYQLLNIMDSTSFETKNEMLNLMVNGIDGIYDKTKIHLNIKTGFMQGILHHTSSLFHTIVQEGFKQIKLLIIQNTFRGTNFEKESKLTALWNLQGSDDSMEMIITDAKLYKSNTKLFLTLMHLKDLYSYKFGIIPSKEKTATCVPYVMEYNSNWTTSGINVQPMIKFSMVASNIPTLQSLVQRQEFYYNLLKDCLEKGCTTYTCSKIKIAQAVTHYYLLGNVNVPLFDLYAELLMENKNPSLGYFITEPNVYTGVFGFDFSCYYHFKNTDFGVFGDEEMTPFELVSTNKTSFRSNLMLSKMQWSNWKTLVSMCGELTESENEFLESNSYYYYINYHGWEVEKLKLRQKIQDHDVKQSLSSKYGASENAAAFFVLFVDICKSKDEKHSLIDWVKLYDKKITDKESFLHKIFPRHENYDEIIHILKIFKNESYVIDTDYVKRGKSKVVMLNNPINLESDYLEVIKHRWFSTEMSFSKQEYYDRKFDELKTMFPWLKETEKETKEHLKCSSRQLANYLRSMLGKVRQLTFLDTNARDFGWKYTLTRIFKEGKKIVRFGHEPITQKSNNDVFYNLKALCVVPYSTSFQMKELKSLINEHLNFNDLPPSKKYDYTILQKILNEESHNEIVNLIMDKSQTQMISYFKTAQYYNKDSEKWEGHGVLYFMHEHLHGKIIFEDEIVDRIIVNDLHALNQNHGELRKLLKSFKSEFKTDEPIALRFTMNSIHHQTSGAIVELDDKIKHDPSSLKNFNIAFERGNFKIVASVVDGQRNKEAINLQELYLVEFKRRPKTYDERKMADSKGFIETREWIQNYQYNETRHGDIIKRKVLANGRDARHTTIINFEMWKQVQNPYCKQLFEWGFLAMKMLRNEEIEASHLFDDIIRVVPNSVPIEKIRSYYLKKCNYSEEIKTVAYRAMSLDPSMGTLISEHKTKEEIQIDIHKEVSAMLESFKFEKIRTSEHLFGFDKVDFESLTHTEEDFAYHKDIIYPDIRATYSMPTNIFYFIRSEAKKYITENSSIENLLLFSENMINVPLRLQLLLNVLFETDIVSRANTMKRLKLEMFKSDSEYSIEMQSFASKSSKSSQVIPTKIIDNSASSQLLVKFKIDSTQENFKSTVETELNNLDEVIRKLDVLINQENVARLKYSMINQKVKFFDDKNELERLYKVIELEKLKSIEVIIEEKDRDDESEDSDISKPLSEDYSSISGSFESEYSASSREDVNPFKVSRLEFQLKDFDWLKLIGPLNYFQIKEIIEIFSAENFKDHLDRIAELTKMSVTFINGDEVESFGDELITINIIEESYGFDIFLLENDVPNERNLEYKNIILNTKVIPISSNPDMSCLFNALIHVLKFHNTNLDQGMLRTLCANYRHEVEDDEIRQHQASIMDTNVMGNEMDIVAISNIFMINVKVITHYGILNYNENFRKSPHYLLNYDNIHFDILEDLI